MDRQTREIAKPKGSPWGGQEPFMGLTAREDRIIAPSDPVLGFRPGSRIRGVGAIGGWAQSGCRRNRGARTLQGTTCVRRKSGPLRSPCFRRLVTVENPVQDRGRERKKQSYRALVSRLGFAVSPGSCEPLPNFRAITTRKRLPDSLSVTISTRTGTVCDRWSPGKGGLSHSVLS